MMKKIGIVTILSIGGLLCSVYGQKSKQEILKSSDIGQIEKYLETAHPDDPKRFILKKRLVALKNEAWTKGAKTAVPMAARPIESQEVSLGTLSAAEMAEFKKLVSETSSEHKEKTVRLLNNLFSENPNNEEAILLVRNHSDCDMILRIHERDQHQAKHNLAVPSRGENFIVVKKNNYQLSGSLCGSAYHSDKKITKGTIIELKPKMGSDVKAAK